MPDKPDTKTAAGPTQFGARTVVGRVDIDTLTPRRVKRMLLAAESGDLSAQADLFEKMEEKDGELDAYLRTRKAGVARLRFEIQPADRTPKAQEAAELCRSMVAEIANLPQAIFDLLDAIPKGLGVQEIEWNTERDRWRPVRLVYRPQRWFTLADDGDTLLLRESSGRGTELNPLNFVIHRVKARSGFCARTGLLRSCVRAFIVRHFAWKDWMAFAEVYGMPPRVGWLQQDVAWDSEEARELWQAVRALGMDAAAVVREGNRIEMLDTRSAGEGRVFERILDRAGRELTLAILGQLLTSGGDKGGSYALGQVHNQVRWDLIEADALALARTLTEQLLQPMVRLNLGGEHRVPNWHFDAEQPEDLSNLAVTVKTLSEAGLAIPAEWAYGKFGIPSPTPGEPVLGHAKEE
ncbi:MAG: phage portal protein family protein [Planctomycetota bacterium]|jgi:phage gp29-like protein